MEILDIIICEINIDFTKLKFFGVMKSTQYK